MPAIRAIAAVVILLILPNLSWAQAPAPEPNPAPSPAPPDAAQASVPVVDSSANANYVIADAIIKLRARTRIAAQIEQTIDMLNQKFELKGFYYKDTGNRLRLQLDLVGMGDASSTMLQVCDGKVLWEYQKVLGMRNYRKRDIIPVLKKLEDPALDDVFRAQVMVQLGFGGPEALMAGFQEVIAFNQFAEQEVDGVLSYVIGGQWKDRTKLVGPNDRQLSPTAQLPPYIPANIRVFVNKATTWPYRIEMIGNAPSLIEEDTREIDPITKRPIGVRRPQPKVDPSNITLRYTLLPESEIKPDEQFVFNAPRDASNLIDETQTFLDELDKVIQYKMNEKKAKDAASEAAGEPLIKTPDIPVPNNSPAPAPIDTAPPAPPR